MPAVRDQVFISYCHKDRKWLSKLQTMLKPMVRNKIISVWEDTKINAGDEWRSELKEALARAKAAVLLVSPYFLESDFIAEHELPPLLDTAKKEGLVILWVYISHCLYDETEIERYQVANEISKPLDSLTPSEQNRVLADVCRKIKATASPEDASRLLPPQSEDLLTGPLTIAAVLKGAENQIINDAYPTGDRGVHFRFSLFNGNAFDFLVHEVHVDVLAYAPLNFDHLLHGVGATDVERSFRATIRPELGSYGATYFGGRQGEYVTIPPSKSETFDVEIATPTEGLYDISVRILGGSAGNRFDVLLDSTKRRVAFFDVTAGYMVDRGWGLGGPMLTYEKYSAEMKSGGKGGY
jgi:hypothetical protein